MESWLPAIIVAGTAAVIATITGIVKFSRWTGAIDEQRSEAGKFMKEIRDDIKSILARLPNDVVAGGSPLRLTDLGEAISTELEAKTWAWKLAQEMKQKVEGKPAYEINDFAFDYVKNTFQPSEEQEARIRSCAYENALSAEKVGDVLAVELRDALLKLVGAPVPNSGETANPAHT